jgi:hypothetical protein
MKTLSCLGDWKQLGVIYLTGEACNLNMRVLCDLTQQAKETVLELLGLPQDTKLGEAANGGGEAVASMMIPRDMFNDIGILGLLNDGAAAVYVPPSTADKNYRIDFSVCGIYESDTQESRHHETVNEIVEMFQKRYDGGRVFRYNENHPHVGSMNCRAF